MVITETALLSLTEPQLCGPDVVRLFIHKLNMFELQLCLFFVANVGETFTVLNTAAIVLCVK